jgi:hypothetical protein
MQKEQELMKNNNIKEMIRQQKMMAEERKEMVSYIHNSFYLTFILGISRETFAIKKQADK